MADLKSQSKKAFDNQAKSYDSSSYSRYARSLYPSLLRALSGYDFDSLLDLGCGTGEVLKLLAEQYPGKALYGLDLSANMIGVARQKLGESVTLAQGDAEELPFDSEMFDLVTCCYSFHHYPAPDRAMAGVYRALKPGGRFVVCDMWQPMPLRAAMNVFFRFTGEGDVRVYSLDELTALYSNAGFTDISWERADRSSFISMGRKPLS